MKVAVFCASAEHVAASYPEAARQLGTWFGKLGWHLVYGGTNLGLMREVADATIASGGEVTGIIPECIRQKGVAAEGKGCLIVTPDMKERKQQLRDYADAFIALPGGWGTLEEITEVVTLKQLGEHQKPIVFLNINGFYDAFFGFIGKCRQEGFISGSYDQVYEVVDRVEDAIACIRTYRPGKVKSKY